MLEFFIAIIPSVSHMFVEHFDESWTHYIRKSGKELQGT
jgi:hypothetical protein